MKEKRVQVGIDFSKNNVDIGLYNQDGKIIHKTRTFSNSKLGFERFKEVLKKMMMTGQYDGINISGEATSYYWMPFFMEIAKDEELKKLKVHLFLLNALLVKNFKKGFPRDNKTDSKDAFYIAERTRTWEPGYEWELDEEWMPLRFYTRARFHNAQCLIREKNYFYAILFLINCVYSKHKAFEDMFGKTSCDILEHQYDLDEFLQQDDYELAEYLQNLSKNNLKDPFESVEKLKKGAKERFILDENLAFPIQRILNLTLDNIHHFEKQIKIIDGWIREEAKNHPQVECLASIPGIGPVFSSGIAAEIGSIHRFLKGEKYDNKKGRFRKKRLKDVEAAVAKIAGLWWPLDQSGEYNSEARKMAKSGNRYLRYYLIEAANHLRRWNPDYSEYFHKKYVEATRFRHKRALVLTARKSIRLFVGLLHRNEPYCPKEAA